MSIEAEKCAQADPKVCALFQLQNALLVQLFGSILISLVVG